jgi:diguanylate cyclase (GGDEF)-like protein
MAEIPRHIEDRLKLCRSLPTVPAVAVRVIDLCEQDEVGAAEIASILARDPVLAAKLLKTANSAFYGLRSQITTLDRAISVLGTNATLSLSLSFSLVETVRRSSETDFHHQTYWRRSVITAATARVLGSLLSRTVREELFLAGLLQDIGMLVLNEIAPGTYGQVVWSAKGSHERLVELEKEEFGTDHAAIGGWLLQGWKLPELLQASVMTSHESGGEDDSDTARFCRATALAGSVAEIFTNPLTAAATAMARQHACDRLQMRPDRFDALLEQVAASLPDVTSNLELQIGSQEALDRIFSQAREELVVLNLRAQEQVRRAQQAARFDGLTSLYNRSHFEDVLPQHFEAAVRSGEPLSVIFLDIDHFKRVNDAHGHQAGDLAINLVAGLLQSVLHPSDLLARYGGEEFVCLLANMGAEDAGRIAERLRAAIAAETIHLTGNAEVRITVSLGCATMTPAHPFTTATSLLREADRCLYIAKEGGRNRVVFGGELPTSSQAASGATSAPLERSVACPIDYRGGQPRTADEQNLLTQQRNPQ